MKRSLLLLLSIACFLRSHGQADPARPGRVDIVIIKERKPPRIYCKVTIASPFPGGDSSWRQALEKDNNRAISSRKRVQAGSYSASVAFILDRDGNSADVRCVLDPGFGFCADVVRAVKKWPLPTYSPHPVMPYRH